MHPDLFLHFYIRQQILSNFDRWKLHNFNLKTHMVMTFLGGRGGYRHLGHMKDEDT